MTNAPTNASAEVTAADSAARWPVLFLICSAIKWLVLAGILSLINSIQLIRPSFLADCSVFTYGRTVAMQESIFIYGWAANAGLGIALYVLTRLGGSPLRAGNWVIVGTIFWNVAVTLGLIGIATGDATSIVFLQLPRYVQLMMVFAYATIALPGVLAWVSRRHESTYAAQWYAVAALFLFPWLLSAAQMMLLWSPLRGVLQAVASGWYAQGAWTLWLAPLGLTGAYYVVPKITGRSLPSYEFAPHAFWCLLVIGAWTGGRHLVGGPVPAWIASVSIVACALLLFHYFVVLINLRGAIGGGGTTLKFISFGLMAYALGGLLDAITSFRDVAVELQFTMVDTAQRELAVYGGVSMMFFGAIYYLVPRLTNTSWSSAGFVVGHRIAAMAGVVVLVIALTVAGWNQGHSLLNAKMTFAEIASNMGLPLLAAVAAQALLLAGNVLFAINFGRTVCKSCCASAPADSTLFRQPSTMEASAS